MRNGTCIKCGNATVHAARNALSLGGRHSASLYPQIEPGFRGIVTGHQTDGIWQFACGTCGYFEMYVLDAEAIAFIRQAWRLLPPTRR